MDIFGKTISLNFGKDQSTHDTKLGGTLTMIFVMLIFIYTSL